MAEAEAETEKTPVSMRRRKNQLPMDQISLMWMNKRTMTQLVIKWENDTDLEISNETYPKLRRKRN